MSDSMGTQRYYSHGKLLITGEYFVLDGALALAVPTCKGQSLTIDDQNTTKPYLNWESYTSNGECWFSGRFSLPDGTFEAGTDRAIGQRLEQILKAGQELQARPWRVPFTSAYSVRTDLEFPRDWGLGTSSTLIANLAKWWKIDPYQLLEKTFGGSGYDLACADAGAPLFYRLYNGQPISTTTIFNPPFHGRLSFLYLDKKQNSRTGILNYREKGTPSGEILERISGLSREFTQETSLEAFMRIMQEHERIVGEWMGTEPVKQKLFPNFPGMIKSLGAWGGDFVLVASESSFAETKQYFTSEGYSTLIPFSEMVLSPENGSLNSN